MFHQWTGTSTPHAQQLGPGDDDGVFCKLLMRIRPQPQATNTQCGWAALTPGCCQLLLSQAKNEVPRQTPEGCLEQSLQGFFTFIAHAVRPLNLFHLPAPWHGSRAFLGRSAQRRNVCSTYCQLNARCEALADALPLDLKHPIETEFPCRRRCSAAKALA